MTLEFYKEYLYEYSRKRTLLYVMNPKKLQACQYLINHHERHGDKITVLSDNVYALIEYNSQYNQDINPIFLSKVGDASIDLLEATCFIQISSHYGPKRQEEQRLGCILRAKRRNDEGFNAFFYSSTSRDTREMYYSAKRQQFLIEQSYAFKVITDLEGIDNDPNMVYKTRQEQMDLLKNVLLTNDADLRDDEIDDIDDVGKITDRKVAEKNSTLGLVKRQVTTTKTLVGGDSMVYIEYNCNSSGGRGNSSNPSKEHHNLFKKIYG